MQFSVIYGLFWNFSSLLVVEMECTLGGILEDDTFSWVESSKRRRLDPSSRLNDAFPTGEDLNDILQVIKYRL